MGLQVAVEPDLGGGEGEVEGPEGQDQPQHYQPDGVRSGHWRTGRPHNIGNNKNYLLTKCSELAFGTA